MSLNFNFNVSKVPLKRARLNRLLRYLPLVTLIILLLTTAGSLIFLYRYFYQTIAQVKLVSILKSQVSLHQVNLPLYQKVFGAWEQKKAFDPKTLEGLRDPFTPLPPSTPPAAETQPTPAP